MSENIFLGNEPRHFGIPDQAQIGERSRAVLKQLGLPFTPRTRVSSLSLGERQMVEIARALSTNARIIVMDEPTTSLTSRETEKLFEVIAALKEHGIAIIYISHRMEEVYQIADRVTVLRDAGYVGTLDRSELSASRLVSMMVGRDLSGFYKKDHAGLPPRARRLSHCRCGTSRAAPWCGTVRSISIAAKFSACPASWVQAARRRRASSMARTLAGAARS